MDKQKLIQYIESRIETFIKNGDKKSEADFRHHKTTLNNITERYQLISEKMLAVSFFDDFEKLQENYKAALIKANKSDVRSPLTRLKYLKELYASLVQPIKNDETTLSQMLLLAAKRLYGDKFYTGPVDNYHKIQADYITVASLCRTIVFEGHKKDPNLFGTVDNNKKFTLYSAAKKIQAYFTGESLPSTRVPAKRLHYIEDFLGLDKGSISERAFGRYSVKKKSDLYVERRTKAKLAKKVSRKVFNHTVLNDNLQRYFEEYKAYKTLGSQPVLRNVSQEMRDDEYAAYRLMVNEGTSKHQKKWTLNAKGEYPSVVAYYAILKAFLNFCVEEKGLAFEEVSTNHLTDPMLLRSYAEYARQGNSPSSVERLLNIISVGCQKRGYLRLCGERGDRSIDKFNRDLDFIEEQYPELVSAARSGLKRSKNRVNQTGKENITFLLDMHWKDRRNVVYQASVNMLKQVDYFIHEANESIAKAKKSNSDVAKQRRVVYAATCADKAMALASTALIMESSFLVAPRATTWSQLRYYSSVSAKEVNTPCIVYHSHKESFEIDVPVFGYDIGNNSQTVRLLKNSESENIVPINAFYPLEMTPLFKKFLKARKLYLEAHIPVYIEVWMKKYDEHILSIKEADISSFSKDAYLNAMEENYEIFKNYDPKKVDMLFPFFAYRTKPDIKDRYPKMDSWNGKLMVRRRYARTSTKLGEDFVKTTCDVFADLLPEVTLPAVNIHAMRHLAVISFLDEHPGAYSKAAAILNDEEEQIIKTYGKVDRAIMMRHLSADYSSKNRTYE